MKIPLEWLKQYVETNKSAKQLAESFTALGLMLDKPVINYKNDTFTTEILDLEHRMDRSDWLSIIGCARDLAAFEKLTLKFPELYTKKGITPKPEQVVDIQVKCPDLVKRFNTRVFRNITVSKSPDWLRNRLESYGIPSINNIVDITNYVMVELGQPMHAQDLAKMEKQEIVIRRGRTGESITTLLGENVALDENCFVLTQNDIPTVLGGIVGGKATGIDETTKDIVLDAGNYDQNNIRKTSRRLKIQNESVLRNDKFLHPMLTEMAIQRATKLILDLAGGDFYENIDWYPNIYNENMLTFHYDRLKLISGMEFYHEGIKEILTHLNYTIMQDSETMLNIKVPYFRTDVEVEDDIVADVLRINNYSNIPVTLIGSVPPKEITPDIYKFTEKIKDMLVRMGAHEHITDPLVPYNENNPKQIKLENSQSSEKNSLRTSLDDTLRILVDIYKKYHISNADIFEVGNIYTKLGNDFSNYNNYKETLALKVISYDANAGVLETASHIKTLLSGLLLELGIKSYNVKETEDKYNIFIDDDSVGVLRNDSFSLVLDKLINKQSNSLRIHIGVSQVKSDDISLIMPIDKKLGALYQWIRDFSEQISAVEVEAIKMSPNEKNIIIHIFHQLQDFTDTRNIIINKIKDFDKEIIIKS